MGFVANFIRFPAMLKFWKSVKVWQSYSEFKGGNFFWDTVHKTGWCSLQCKKGKWYCINANLTSHNWCSVVCTLLGCLTIVGRPYILLLTAVLCFSYFTSWHLMS